MHSEKMKAKYMNEDVRMMHLGKMSFFVNSQVGISQLDYRLTSLEIISGILSR